MNTYKETNRTLLFAASQSLSGNGPLDWKNRRILSKILENKNKYWKRPRNLAARKLESMEIWCYTLNKKSTLKNTGKVREICQSEKVGSMQLLTCLRTFILCTGTWRVLGTRELAMKKISCGSYRTCCLMLNGELSAGTHDYN